MNLRAQQLRPGHAGAASGRPDAGGLAPLACLLLLLSSACALAAQQSSAPLTFTFDPAATSIHWTLNTTIHTVHGTFKLKSGSVTLDPATGDASGLITVSAASGESGEPSRDNRMQKVVLESDRYPDITFRPTHVQGAVTASASGSITVDGIFNLHGQDHPLQLTVSLHPTDAALAAHTRFVIPFVAWGLKDPSIMMFRTEKQVAIDIDAIAIPSPH